MVTLALEDFPSKKTAGPDGLKPILLKNLPDSYKAHLTLIYKASIHLKYVPKLWKDTNVIFISKPGKTRYDTAKAFRPISLSNYVLKGLEKLVTWRVDTTMKTKPIHGKQHGFQKGKSTETALSQTVNFIEKAMFKGKKCVGVFLDISSAFDTIDPGHVRHSLLEHGAEEDIAEWFYNYQTHRELAFSLQGTKKVVSTNVGFPQGGVCSAKFWAIAYDKAVHLLNSNGVEGTVYADDSSALISGDDYEDMLERLQIVVDSVISWGNSCGLKFNHTKTVVISFGTNSPPVNKLKINGNSIEYGTSVRYLGVELDSRLEWKLHIEQKLCKAKQFLYNTCKVTRDRYGPKPALMKWAYEGIVLPALCYGCLVWGTRVKKYMSKFRRLNRMAINSMVQIPRSTPTRAVELIVGLMPIDIVIKGRALSSFHRVKGPANQDWDGKHKTRTTWLGHLKYWETQSGGLYDNGNDVDIGCNNQETREYNINLESFKGDKKHQKRSQYTIYTDGSKQNEKVGVGYQIYKGNTQVLEGCSRLPDWSTVFQAEIRAIELACICLMNSDEAPKYVKVFSDSQAAVRALYNHDHNQVSVSNTNRALNKLNEKVKYLSLAWTRGHVGNVGNERADMLAKAGTELDVIIPSHRPLCHLKESIRQEQTKDWNKDWGAYKEGRMSKQFIKEYRSKDSSTAMKFGKNKVGTLVRIITGHNALNYFGSKVDPEVDPLCRFCQEDDETFWHLATVCPVFWKERMEILLGDDIEMGSWDVERLLEFASVTKIAKALEGFNDIWFDESWLEPTQNQPSPEPD